MRQQTKYLVSIIWGYSTHMYKFAPEENYHLHVLNIAKEVGYIPVVIIRQTERNIENDPCFDKNIKVINYKNIFNYFFQIIKYSCKGAVFYINSVEPQSLCVPFLARKTIFMGHTQPIRQTKFKQKVFDFVMSLVFKIRLNNEEEKQFLLKRGLNKNKLEVVPLAISEKVYQFNGDYHQRENIVYFGNITKKKNLITILKAFKIVLEENKDIKLHIIGEILEKDFEKQIKELNIFDNVVIHGFCPAEKANELLNNFKICINSSFQEGQCLSVYNAALAGCALCLPDIMSFRGVFKDKAIFHNREDHEKLAENIIFYLKNSEIRIKHNNLCREMIKDNYNYNIISEKLKKMLTF